MFLIQNSKPWVLGHFMFLIFVTYMNRYQASSTNKNISASKGMPAQSYSLFFATIIGCESITRRCFHSRCFQMEAVPRITQRKVLDSYALFCSFTALASVCECEIRQKMGKGVGRQMTYKCWRDWVRQLHNTSLTWKFYLDASVLLWWCLSERDKATLQMQFVSLLLGKRVFWLGGNSKGPKNCLIALLKMMMTWWFSPTSCRCALPEHGGQFLGHEFFWLIVPRNLRIKLIHARAPSSCVYCSFSRFTWPPSLSPGPRRSFQNFLNGKTNTRSWLKCRSSQLLVASCGEMAGSDELVRNEMA